MNAANRHWRFFRAGGFDQVRLDGADDLLAIGELDQKLWVALSCPVKGIQFDERTLALVDADADGHVRAYELIAAVRWAAERLADPQLLGLAQDGLAVDDISHDTEAGQRLVAAARVLADELGKAANERLSVAEVSTAQARHAARVLAAWEAEGTASAPLGGDSEAACDALLAVTGKIDDFFLRCRLAAFDARASEALDVSEDTYKALSADVLLQETSLTRLPLARITAEGALPLHAALNPAWAPAMAAFRSKVVQPLLGDLASLTEAQWRGIQDRFSGYMAWRASRPDQNDDDAVRELEQLVRYVRDLLKLANNFVAFKDFYTRQGKATFQAGTLYLDGRSCELCVAVADPARHAMLATLSRICLVYCDCVRGSQKMTVAAAFTAGDADQLMVGRNGVFYDRHGDDWDATIVKIIDHPISLRQAFWSPYKRLARMVGEQLQKLAASKAKESEDRMALAATRGVAAAGAKAAAAPAAQQAFDVGKFAGIFAAIGLAVGAIGTALASVIMGVLALKWWQIPLALIGFMLIISGPAVLLAWFKLRTRNLGPILDANGWAINARACINIPFGTSLTQIAALPPNAERSLTDPYAEKKPPRWFYPVLVALVLAVGAIWWAVRVLLS